MLTVRPGLGTAHRHTALERLEPLHVRLAAFEPSRPDDDRCAASRRRDHPVSHDATRPPSGSWRSTTARKRPARSTSARASSSDRRQAQRWEVSPNFAHRVRPHTSVTGSYDFMAESLVDNGTGRMQVARAGLSQIVSARSTVSGVVQERHFADPTRCDQRQRFRRGPRRLGPSVLARRRASRCRRVRASRRTGACSRKSTRASRATRRVSQVGADYSHGETIVLGIRGPVTFNGGGARVTWPFRRTMEISSHSAATAIDTLDEHASRRIARRSSRRGHPAASTRSTPRTASTTSKATFGATSSPTPTCGGMSLA